MKRFALFFACLALTVGMFGINADAATKTDEVVNYEITVDVNEDATLNMLYHIEWKVLDSDIYGPVTWLKIGIPNDYFVDYRAVSDNITSISPVYGGGSFMEVYFDRSYYENETVSFDFMIVMDNMYEMNILTDGETVYYLTPGWFDGVDIDRLCVKWNSEKAIGNSSSAVNKDGYLVWEFENLLNGATKEVSVTYESTAFGFDSSKTAVTYPNGNWGNYYNDDYNDNYYYDDYYYSYNSEPDYAETLVGLVPLIFVISTIVIAIKSNKNYKDGSNFESGKTTKKITRTLIKYYPVCQGCGAVRAENQEKCEYCGRSFIESEEVVEEKEVKEPEKYSSEGTYRYSDSPNTFIRVHVTHIPAPPPSRPSCAHSSCAHSSCACAHSCACACACACAGGGRAGCSVKDFYNTNLKLRQLSKKK